MRIFILITSFLFTLGMFFMMFSEGISFYAIAGIILFGSGFIFTIFDRKIDIKLDILKKKRQDLLYCIIKDDHILFPNGYYFKFGYLKKKNNLFYSRINEIRLNTFPTTVLINGNEIIFLILKNKDEIINFAKRNNIKVEKPIDNWSLICEEFLDTEFDEDWKQNTTQTLNSHGINQEELNRIRKKISTRMLIWTFVSWEWVYYGQYDVLKQIGYLNSKKYWWTMEIALRSNKTI